MRIAILGAGEAFDETTGNTCALVSSNCTLLLDCGYAAPFQVWRRDPSPDLIDGIYISHAHADHYFGLPALLTRMWEDGRRKPLTLISQKSVLNQICQLLDLGYAGVSKRFQFEIAELEATPGQNLSYQDLRLRFAPTVHSTTNLAVRIESAGRSFVYSGDGMFTAESIDLMRASDLVLHEAYSFEQSPVHADIPRLLEMAESAGVRRLVMTHVQRTVRKNGERMGKLETQALILARPGDEFEI